MSSIAEAMVECDEGAVRVLPDGSFTVEWGGESVDTYSSFGEALAELCERCGTYSGPVTYALPREQLWEAAEEVGVEEILPYSPHGWVRYEDVWLPGAFLPDYDGPDDSFPELLSFGDMGCESAVRQWEDVFLITWHGPEWEGKGFRVAVNTSLEEVAAEAEAKAFEIQADWNLLYDEFVGLGNLSEADRFPVPADVEELGTVESYLREWGDHAATVYVLHWHGGDDAPFLVTDGTLVVGRYGSLDELRENIDPGESFGASDELIDPDDDE